MSFVDRHGPGTRRWVAGAMHEVDADRCRDTHLHVFPLPSGRGVNLSLKDEPMRPEVHSNIE
ncbi:hypothetical protein [Nonomuraea sp. B1E8]|uniref:hypothetical protein n=1 Tax=unclassified Nonomuraea TaxID=2593643 RepID=UPI00325EA38A